MKESSSFFGQCRSYTVLSLLYCAAKLALSRLFESATFHFAFNQGTFTLSICGTLLTALYGSTRGAGFRVRLSRYTPRRLYGSFWSCHTFSGLLSLALARACKGLVHLRGALLGCCVGLARRAV